MASKPTMTEIRPRASSSHQARRKLTCSSWDGAGEDIGGEMLTMPCSLCWGCVRWRAPSAAKKTTFIAPQQADGGGHVAPSQAPIDSPLHDAVSLGPGQARSPGRRVDREYGIALCGSEL